MSHTTSQKIKLLVLYDMLCRLTDEEHALNTDELIKFLEEKGIRVDPRVLKSDIDMLNDYGYEVLSYKKKYYYYYVASRQFESAEIAMLADIVSASKLNANRKKTLIGKLAGTLGNNKANVMMKNVLSFEKPKRSNAHIIYNIDRIDTAINEKKKVSFLYFSLDYTGNKVYRKDGKRYLVNPLVMIWSQDNYYLLCYDDIHPDLVTYRIDRMSDVKVEQEDRTEREEFASFNTEQYRTQVFSMFGGELQRVELLFTESMINDVFDKFGEDIRIRKTGDGDYRATIPIQVSKVFFTWIVGSQGKVKIVSPQKVKDEFKAFIDKIKKKY